MRRCGGAPGGRTRPRRGAVAPPPPRRTAVAQPTSRLAGRSGPAGRAPGYGVRSPGTPPVAAAALETCSSAAAATGCAGPGRAGTGHRGWRRCAPCMAGRRQRVGWGGLRWLWQRCDRAQRPARRGRRVESRTLRGFMWQCEFLNARLQVWRCPARAKRPALPQEEYILGPGSRPRPCLPLSGPQQGKRAGGLWPHAQAPTPPPRSVLSRAVARVTWPSDGPTHA